MNADNNEATLQAYEQGLNEYIAADLPETIGSVKGWIDAGLAMLTGGDNVLELGSAYGRDAAYIESKGFKVDRTDAVHSFVEFMQQAGHPARILNALTDDYGGPYNMIYANAVLLHFSSEQIPGVLQRVHNALEDNGLFAFSVKIGKSDGWSDAKLNLPRYFSYWHEQPLRDLLEDSNFEIVYWKEGQTGHDNGDWFHVITKGQPNDT